MQIPHDFPPVPKCFSHLLNAHIFYTENESEDQTLSQSLPTTTRHVNVIPELNNSSFGRSLSDNSQPHSTSLTTCYNSEGPTSTTIGGGSGSLLFYPYQYQDVFSEDGESQKLKTPLAHSANFMSPCTKRRMVMTQQSSSDPDSEQVEEKECRGSQDLSNPFVKLNSSLEKLQKEMRELRLFDVSLFYQLLSLHESIQDLKLNINDRYSETGSECSLGSASYMGSMSSLDEESDWGESQVFLQSFRGEESAADDDENRQSTSSLLEQITALTQKAEEDI